MVLDHHDAEGFDAEGLGGVVVDTGRVVDVGNGRPGYHLGDDLGDAAHMTGPVGLQGAASDNDVQSSVTSAIVTGWRDGCNGREGDLEASREKKGGLHAINDGLTMFLVEIRAQLLK